MVLKRWYLSVVFLLVLSACTNLLYEEEIVYEDKIEVVANAIEDVLLPEIQCIDDDGDGYGDGKDCLGLDCNDQDPMINPSVRDVCGDGIDNDCRNGDAECEDTSLDSDYDKLKDFEELRFGTDPKNRDTDGDGLTDYEEIVIYGTDPFNYDTDGDSYCDGGEIHSSNTDPKDVLSAPEVDSDNDGLSDEWELRALSSIMINRGLAYGANEDMDTGATGTRALPGRRRGDGLTNMEEYCIGTSPIDADSDNDGLADGDEWKLLFTDPLNADTDGDGFNDRIELYVEGTDPLNADSFPIYTETRNIGRKRGVRASDTLGSYRKTANWLGQPLQ